MRTIKFYKRELPVNASGTAVIICMDELHADIFKETATYVADISEGRTPPISLVSKIMYCFVKTANPDLFKTYSDFMSSTKSIEPFLNADNTNVLMEEISEFYGADEDEEKGKEKKPDTSKKKKAE